MGWTRALRSCREEEGKRRNDIEGGWRKNRKKGKKQRQKAKQKRKLPTGRGVEEKSVLPLRNIETRFWDFEWDKKSTDLAGLLVVGLRSWVGGGFSYCCERAFFPFFFPSFFYPLSLSLLSHSEHAWLKLVTGNVIFRKCRRLSKNKTNNGNQTNAHTINNENSNRCLGSIAVESRDLVKV